MISNHQEVAQYLKKNDIVLYDKYKTFLDKPELLLEEVIRYYQWIFEIQDFSKLNLQDLCNRNHLNLFIYAFESKPELADGFINHFVQSFRNSFDYETRKWSADLIFNTFIHQCSEREFDLLAMYALVGATYDRFSRYLIRVHVDPSLNLAFKEVVQFFELIINQSFFDELKAEVDAKRQNSFYFKPSDTPINLPKQIAQGATSNPTTTNSHGSNGIDEDTRRQLEALKKAQANSEAEFMKWDKAEQKALKKAEKENGGSEAKRKLWLVKSSNAKKMAKLEAQNKKAQLPYDNLNSADDIVPKTDEDRELVLKSLRSYAKKQGLHVSYRDLIEQESDGGMIGYTLDTPADVSFGSDSDAARQEGMAANTMGTRSATANGTVGSYGNNEQHPTTSGGSSNADDENMERLKKLQKNSDLPIDTIGLQHRSGSDATGSRDAYANALDNNENSDDTTASGNNKFAPRPDIKIIKIRRY